MKSICLNCRHYGWAVEIGMNVMRAIVIDECYYPANNRKVGHATTCEEFEPKPTPPEAANGTD